MKRIKIIIILLLIAMLSMAFSAMADEVEYPYIFNDEILYFGADKPIDVLDGVAYAPMELYLEKLGGTYIYDGVTKSLTIFKGTKIIAFNMNTYQVITSDGRFLFAKTYFQNESFYVPLDFFIKELGGKFSMLPGNIPRATTGRQALTDGELSAIIASKPKNSANVENPLIYLEIRGISGSGVERIISSLNRYNVKAAFFATAKEILENPEIVREIYVDGHTLGVYTGGLSTQNAVSEVETANRLLRSLVKTNTVIVLHPAAGSALRNTMESNGYIVWGNNLARTVDGGGSSIVNVLESVKWNTAVLFRDDVNSASTLDRVLASVQKSRFAKISEPIKAIN